MKTRLLLALTLVVAACSSGEATTDTGLARTTSTPAPTTTTPARATEGADVSGEPAETTVAGALPTQEPVDAGSGDAPPATVPLEVEPCDPPTEDLAAYCQPFELRLGDTLIVWDRYFWGQGTFSKGTVEVYHGDELVAAGPFVGEGSIVEQDESFNFIFYDAGGTVVAIASQDVITPAIAAALDELNG